MVRPGSSAHLWHASCVGVPPSRHRPPPSPLPGRGEGWAVTWLLGPAPTVRGPGRGLISWFPPVLCRGHLRVQMSPGPPGACKSCLSVSALLPLRGMSKLPLFSSCMCQRLPRCLVFLSLLAGVKSTWNNPLCICVLGHRPRVRGHSRG